MKQAFFILRSGKMYYRLGAGWYKDVKLASRLGRSEAVRLAMRMQLDYSAKPNIYPGELPRFAEAVSLSDVGEANEKESA